MINPAMINPAMSNLLARALRGLVFLLVAILVLLLLPAWSLGYWEAWLYVAVFGITTLLITLDLARRDPALLERRLAVGPVAEKEPQQRLIQTLMSLCFLALYVVSALDHRFGWSSVPAALVLIGDVLVIVGLAIVWWTFHENTYTAATVEVAAGQTVTSTGPYAIVRHPMYAGATVLLLGTPPALDSWWGYIPAAAIVLGIVWRLRDEERLLAGQLQGYEAYRHSVRWRLVPFLW